MARILFQPEIEAYTTGVGTEWCPKVHKLVEGKWIQWARRVTRRPSLFIYYHTYERSWVLADWIYRPGTGKGPGLMTEIEVFSQSPDAGGAKGWTIPLLRERCTPAAARAARMRKRLMEKKRLKQVARLMEDEYRKDLTKVLRKKMGNHDITPLLVATGHMPIVLPSDETVRRLRDLTRNRIISTG